MGPTSRTYPGNEGPHSWDEAIGELAGRQHGVVSLRQLRELGLTRHRIEARIEAKRLYRLHRGVYAVGHEALTPKSRFIAAVYACGPGSLLSHRAAGALQGVLGATAVIEVTAPRGCKAKPGIVVHRSRNVHPDDRSQIDGIPVTSVARTLVDLADVLNERQLTSAVRQAEVLKVLAYQPEPQLLRSRAERRLKRLCERHHLPQPQFNVSVADYEVDVYWPEAKLALEFDGAETHQTRFAFHEDRRRDRGLAAEGIQTVRVTWPDLDAQLAQQVREILRQR